MLLFTMRKRLRIIYVQQTGFTIIDTCATKWNFDTEEFHARMLIFNCCWYLHAQQTTQTHWTGS